MRSFTCDCGKVLWEDQENGCPSCGRPMILIISRREAEAKNGQKQNKNFQDYHIEEDCP